MPASDGEVLAFLERLQRSGGTIDLIPDDDGVADALDRACALGLVDHEPAGPWAAVDRASLSRNGRRSLGETLPPSIAERIGFVLQRLGFMTATLVRRLSRRGGGPAGRRIG